MKVVHSQVSETSWDWSKDVVQTTPAQHARAYEQLLSQFLDALRYPADFAQSTRGCYSSPAWTTDLHSLGGERKSTAKPLPYAWRADREALLQYVERQGIVAQLTTDESDWQHPLSFTPKTSSALRVCCHLRRLNQFVRSPTHPCPMPHDIVSQVTTRVSLFTTLDALSGYWHILLAKESQTLTTFITLSSCYRYLRAPMGL